MSLRQTFASNLRRLRTAKGLSQEELAHRANLDRTYISSLERAVYAASLDTLERLAKELSVSPEELLLKANVRRSQRN